VGAAGALLGAVPVGAAGVALAAGFFLKEVTSFSTLLMSPFSESLTSFEAFSALSKNPLGFARACDPLETISATRTSEKKFLLVNITKLL